MADSNGLQDPGAAITPPEIDVSKPHPARMYDYFLGGKDNFAAGRDHRVVPAGGALEVQLDPRQRLRHRFPARFG